MQRDTLPDGLAKFLRWVLRCLQLPGAPRFLMILLLVLYLPSLALGLAGDLAYMIGKFVAPNLFPFDTPLSPYNMFTMGEAHSPTTLQGAVSQGLLPWWTSPAFHFQLWRPLTEFSHALDFALFGKQTWLMHLHQIFWFVLLFFSVRRLFSKIFDDKALVMLSSALYILSGNFAQTVTCLDGRNTLMASVFGIGSLLLHIEAEQRHQNLLRVMSYLFFAAALLSSEFGLGASAWLFSWMVFMDQDKLHRRFFKLVPYGLVMLAWAYIYTSRHYGVADSDIYIDPVRSPKLFLEAFAGRVPGLIFQAFTSIPHTILLSNKVGVTEWWLALAFIALILGLSTTLMRQPVWRFLFFAPWLSILPVSAGPGGGRTLTFVSLGLIPITAKLLLGYANDATLSVVRRRLTAIVAWPVSIMVILGFLEIYALTAAYYINDVKNISGPSANLPVDANKTDQTLVLLNPNSIIFAEDYQPMRAWLDLPRSAHLYSLTSGQTDIDITVDGTHSFLMKPAKGFLYDSIDYFVRPRSLHFFAGEKMQHENMGIEIIETSLDGRPLRVRFSFSESLGSDKLQLLACDHLRYVPVALPAIGETITLPPCERP